MQVTDFRTVLPTLEDVFLKLTGHAIRDLRITTPCCADSGN